MNTIMYEGQIVDVGPTPYALQLCGFKSRVEVEQVALRNSLTVPSMRMKDVVEYFLAKGSR